MDTRVLLCKNGDRMGVATNARDAGDFRVAFANTLAEVIEGAGFADDWAFQLCLWLPEYEALAVELAKNPNSQGEWLGAGWVNNILGSILGPEEDKSICYAEPSTVVHLGHPVWSQKT